MIRLKDPKLFVAILCINAYLVALCYSLVPRALFNLLLEIEPIEEHLSPDGKWILATYFIHQKLPPETDFWVSLRPAGTHLRHVHSQIVTWTESAYSADVVWESPAHVSVTFVSGFGFYGDREHLRIPNQQVGDVEVTVNVTELLQTIEKPLYTITNADGSIRVLAKIHNYQLGPPMEWKTTLTLARVMKEGASTVAKYNRVLVVNGQYDEIPAEISNDGITLVLPATARDAELAQETQLSDLPINIVYAQ